MKRIAVCLFTMFALGLALTSITSHADQKDTVDDVIAAGRATLTRIDNRLRELNEQLSRADDQTKISLNEQISALQKVRPMVSRLSQDRAFAARVLEPSLKNDTTAVSQILQSAMSGLSIQIREIRDWSVYAIIEVSKREKYEMCVGSDCAGGGFFRRI